MVAVTLNDVGDDRRKHSLTGLLLSQSFLNTIESNQIQNQHSPINHDHVLQVSGEELLRDPLGRAQKLSHHARSSPEHVRIALAVEIDRDGPEHTSRSHMQPSCRPCEGVLEQEVDARVAYVR